MMKYLKIILLLNIIFNIIVSQRMDYFQYNYSQIMSIFEKLSHTCRHYIRIDTSQKRYNLDTVEGCGKNKNCSNLIVFMTDFDSYTLDRPAYYISGLVHGDEVIGPTSITEFAKYFCDTYNDNKNSLYHNILKNRIIIMTPMTNSFGYYNNQRNEKIFIKNKKRYKLVDPNRDFPYFNSDENIKNCMQTITARTINEIFNEYIIEGAITFHGGTSVLAYAWGNNVHFNKKNNIKYSTESPDYNAFNNIGRIMVKSSSSKDNLDKNIKNFLLGDMTSTLYPLDGALEDWVYGGWENEVNSKLGINSRPIKTCKPESFNEYYMIWNNTGIKNNYSDYNYDFDYKLRCLIYLAEASENKIPNNELYGFKDFKSDIFDFYNTTNFYGLVPRNMRLIYSGIDLISASIYLDLQNIYIKEYDDYNQIIIPFLFMGCLSLKKYSIYKIDFEYISKNMFEKKYIESTSNSKVILSEVSEGINCYFDNLTYYNLVIDIKEIKNSTNRNLEENQKNNKGKIDHFVRPGGNYDYLNILKSKQIKLNKYIHNKGSIYYIRGEAPDQEWKKQSNPDPNVEPQSHVVRSKTNSSYFVKNGNYSLKSNYYFYSYPIITLDNAELHIVDDVDSFFYDKDLELMQLIINPIEQNYKVVSQIYCQRKLTDKKIPYFLSSENIFRLDLEMHIYENKGDKLKNNIKEKIKYELISEILLSDETDSFHSETLNCEYNIAIGLVIKCDNILSNKNINGRFIRQKLANSILRFELKVKNEIFLSFFGQISLKNENRGKYYIDYYSDFNTNDNNKMICSSNFPNFISILNDTKNGIYLDDIYYEIIINKISTHYLKLNVNIKQKVRNKYKYFIIFFPFHQKIELLNIKKKSEIEIYLDENVNGKIIGKTAYIIPIEDKDNNILSQITFNINEFNSLMFSLNKISNNKNYNYIPCSIMSFNSFRNNDSLNEFRKMSEKFTEHNPFIKKRKKSNFFKKVIIIGVIILFIIGIYFFIIRKYWNGYDSYNQFNSVSISDISDFSQNGW